jgi:hypothetical protein
MNSRSDSPRRIAALAFVAAVGVVTAACAGAGEATPSTARRGVTRIVADVRGIT